MASRWPSIWQILVLDTVIIFINAGVTGEWGGLVALLAPLLLFVCAYCGVLRRNACLLTSFSWCTVICAILTLLGVAGSWFLVVTTQAACAGGVAANEESCDGEKASASVVTSAAISTALSVALTVLLCLGCRYGSALTNQGQKAAFFTTPPPAVVGAGAATVVQVSAQSAPAAV